MSDSNNQIGFVAPLPTDLAPLFPGYEIQGLIATGGMGAVYCAVQKSLDRTVAIKILPVELSKDAAFCAGFEAEAKAMARLNHPNLIGVYDFGEVNGMLYIIMEFVAGRSLFHLANGAAINPIKAIRLVAAICDGLTHAHENGIIHRDIKPSNILLDLNAQPKIGDFGLARPVDWKLEAGQEIFGTPHYTAPEVVNNPHSVDHRADIFSVGVMLHELLTGKLPATDPSPASTIVRCDPRLDTIIHRATQPLPAARYSSAAEMAADLRAIAASKAPTISPTRTGPMPLNRPQPLRHKYPQPKKKSSNMTPILLLLVIAAAAGAYFYWVAKPHAPVPAPSIKIAPARPAIERNQPRPSQPQIENPDPENTLETPTLAPSEIEFLNPVPTGPKLDVSEFYVTARKVMQDRCKPIIFSHESSLKSNIEELENACKKSFLKMDYTRTDAQKALETELQVWKNSNYQLPSALAGSLASYDGLTDIYAKALQKQTALDEKLQTDLAPQAAIYILGLEKEIVRRKAENDPDAITLIEYEIELTKEDPAHFFRLMIGRNPASSKFTEPK